jgi:hypothetical protein
LRKTLAGEYCLSPLQGTWNATVQFPSEKGEKGRERRCVWVVSSSGSMVHKGKATVRRLSGMAKRSNGKRGKESVGKSQGKGEVGERNERKEVQAE